MNLASIELTEGCEPLEPSSPASAYATQEYSRLQREILERLEVLTKSQGVLVQELTLRLGQVEDVCVNMRNELITYVGGAGRAAANANAEVIPSENVIGDGLFVERRDGDGPIQDAGLLNSAVYAERTSIQESERCLVLPFKGALSASLTTGSPILLREQSPGHRPSQLDATPQSSLAGSEHRQSKESKECHISFSFDEMGAEFEPDDLWTMTQEMDTRKAASLGQASRVSMMAGKIRKSMSNTVRRSQRDMLAPVVQRMSRMSHSLGLTGKSPRQSPRNSTSSRATVESKSDKIKSQGPTISSDSPMHHYDSESEVNQPRSSTPQLTSMTSQSSLKSGWPGGASTYYQLLPSWARYRGNTVFDDLEDEEEDDDNSKESDVSTHLPRVFGWATPHTYKRQGARSVLDRTSRASTRHKRLTMTDFLRQHVIVSPFSKKRTVWDVVSMFLIAYDVITIPLQVFEMPESKFSFTLGWIATLFWTCDMPLSFITGYDNPSENRVEKDPRTVVKNYAMTWFCFDILCVAPDWIAIAYGGSDISGVSRSVKILKGLRGLRLLRLVKLRKVLLNFEKRFNNDYLMCYMNLVKLMILIGVLVHYLACGFKGVSDMEDNRGWAAGLTFPEADTGYRYLTSLHWSLTQFQGSMEVHPKTTTERAYAVVVLYLGVIVAAAFISSITNSMTRIQQIYSEKNTRKWILLRYLSDNNISGVLSLRVKMFVEKVVKEERTRAGEVELLTLLPKDLRTDLELESKRPVFAMHPLLYCLTHSNQALAKTLSCVLNSARVANGERVFEKHHSSDRMHVVTSGRLVYAHRDSNLTRSISNISRTKSILERATRRTTKAGGDVKSKANPTHWELDVHEGEVMSEMCLWTRWEYQGFCTAIRLTDLCQLRTAKFEEAIMQTGEQCRRVVRYAIKYVGWMNDDQLHNGQWFNDLSSPLKHEDDED